MDFSEKVKQKKNTERKQILSAFKLTSDSALGSGDKGYAGGETGAGVKVTDTVRETYRITAYYGVKKTAIPEGITDDGDVMDCILEVAGIMKRRITLGDEWWIQSGGPLICTHNEYGTLALLPLPLGGYQYINPKTGKHVKLNKKNSASFAQTAFCFYKSFGDEAMNASDLAKYIFKCLTKADIAFLILASTLVSLMAMIFPAFNNVVFDVIIPSGTIDDIWPPAFIIMGTTFSTFAFMLFRQLWVARIGNKIQLATQGALWIRVLNLPASFFKDYSSGEMAQRTNSINTICSLLSGAIIPILLSTVFSFVFIFQIAGFARSLVLPSILIIFASIGFSIFDSVLRLRQNKEINKNQARMSGLVYQLFSGIAKIKTAGAETRAFTQWAEIYACWAKSVFSPNIFIKLSGALSAMIAYGGTIIIYIIAYQNHLKPADFIAFNVTYGTFFAVITQLAAITASIAEIKPAFDQLAPILSTEPEVSSRGIKIEHLKGNIKVDRIVFTYKEGTPPVLNDMSFEIKAGEYIAFVGATGCGKSTLFRILLGFETPSVGSVYYDSHNISSLDLRSLRRRMGVVLQNGKLFSGDIYSNIVISAPWLTQEDAWRAARAAGFDKDIESMPMGMYTMISEGGGGISGGQQQRLMIARALASSPEIVFFDEATSALDNITQAVVTETLANMNITRIVIAHRLSTIKNCDRIFYLENGKIAETGSFDELMALKGRFFELAKRQLV